MTDKEKLVELIAKAKREMWGKSGLSCEFARNMHIADYLIAHGVTVIPESGIGDMSDGYHTFNELYHHRAVLFSVICNLHPLCAWKAKKHHDGSMYDGMFIVGINTPEGQATYHYDIDPYWDMFHVPEAEFAPEWDGHTPDEAIRRIGLLGTDCPVQRWIPVTEKLPESDPTVKKHIEGNRFGFLTVLVYNGVVKQTNRFFCDETRCGLPKTNGWEWASSNITHWMPLPEPPKGE